MDSFHIRHKWSPAWESVAHNDLRPWPIYSRSFSHDFAIKYGTSCLVHSTAHTVLDGSFLYLAQMITSIRVCAVCKDLWSWPISSRSFSHDFAIKLLKYGTFCRVSSTTCTVLDGFFPYLAQMITIIRGCVMCIDLWPWPISSRSFSHEFAIKLLKYGTSCCVCFTAWTVLDEFFPYLAQMITSMRGWVAHNDLWPWPISSRLLSFDIAYFMDDLHMWHKYNPWRDNVSHTISRSINRSKVKVTQVIRIFAVRAGVSVDHWSTISSWFR